MDTAELEPLVNVRRAVEAQGRKLRWLARRLGISEGHLTRMLNGERTVSPEQARKMADALGLPIDSIIPTERR